MKLWSVPREFEGGTVCVMASGPSLTIEDVDAVREAGIPTAVINTTFNLFPGAWCLYAADESWWEAYPAAMQFAGHKVSVGDIKNVLRLQNTGTTGFDENPQCLRTGGNSGYQGVHLMAHTGAARIILLGFDMHGDGHWHGDHPAPLRKTEPETYTTWAQRFEVLAKHLKMRNIEVVNCTPGSALKSFPMVCLSEILETCNASN